MKLLQPTEREVVVRAEENRNRQKAVELSNEISELTKKYNRATNEILKAEEKPFLPKTMNKDGLIILPIDEAKQRFHFKESKLADIGQE